MSEAGLILASTSPYRRTLLARLGLEFDVASPPFEERKTLPDIGLARDSDAEVPAARLALENAEGKVHSLASLYPQHLLLGSDQVCVCQGQVLGKSGSVDRAIEQLRWLSGKTHHLRTAVALLDTRTGRLWTTETPTELRVRSLDDDEIRRYVERDLPLDSAGSYYSEGLGITLFERVSSEDPTAVIGLPLIGVCRLLREAGLDPLAPVEGKDA